MQSSILVEVDNRVSSCEPSGGARADVSTLTDEDLLRLCARQDNRGLEELVRRYQAPIYRFLTRLLGSTEDAEDAALDVFVRVWQHAARFGFRAKVSTWIYRIAVNIARDAHSRRKSRPQDPWPEGDQVAHMAVGSAEDDALRRLDTEQKIGALEKALERLSESDRLLLVLYYYEERSYEEIQAITNLSYTVLKTRLTRARSRLRTMMGPED